MDRLKVLVVDDESRMRKLVRDFLVKSNFDVLEAGDGEEALDIFYKEKDIALIILDVMMPKLDGIQQKSRDSPFSHGGPFSLPAYQLSFPVNAVHAHLFQIVQHHQVSLVSGTYGA